jgi:membrane protein YdbS with pleckstrin-like domain
MKKVLAEYYDENKILIFAATLGLLYYFYRKITGTDSWYTGKVLIAVFFSFVYLFIIFILKMKKNRI